MLESRASWTATPLAVEVAIASQGAATSSAHGIESAGSGRQVALVLIAFAAAWLSLLAITSLSPRADDIEQLTWVRSLEWGYYKHPPLPTWLLWPLVKLFGLSAGAAYAMGAAFTLSAIALMWQLLTRLRGRRYAGVALLATLCITYYNGRLTYYNHNIVLLLLSTASATLCWQAFATRRLRWWLGLGLALGLGALAKYQIAVTIASVLVFAAQQRAWRDAVHRRGVLLAGLVASALFAPHLLWLFTHDFAPIHYAIESSLGARFASLDRVVESSHWLADQLFNRALPALVLLAIAVRSSRVPAHAALASLASTGKQAPDPARALLLSWGLVPLLFMPLVGLLVGADLQLHWGTSFLLFAVPAMMECWPPQRWDGVAWPSVVTAFVAVQGLLLALSFASSPYGPQALRDHHWRGFDSKALAERIAAPARAALGGPIRVVSGSAAAAGALALQLPERPLVLIGGRFDRSPWVGTGLVLRCGALEIGSVDALTDSRPVGPQFPGLAWRVTLRDAAPPPCPPASP